MQLGISVAAESSFVTMHQQPTNTLRLHGRKDSTAFKSGVPPPHFSDRNHSKRASANKKERKKAPPPPRAAHIVSISIAERVRD
jgi:hypothetical protein